MKLSAALLGALALTSCSSSSWHTFHSRGVSVRYPPGWFATSHALTPVTSPVQALAVASYPLPKNNRGADGCEPKAAVDRLPADGAFVFGWEFPMPSPSGLRPPDFPRRPSHFSLESLTSNECVGGRNYEVSLRQAGRFFQLHVLLGAHASSSTRHTVLRVLDSLRVKAGTRGR
jgi:hypothetical protein